jgi:saccharopepsin
MSNGLNAPQPIFFPMTKGPFQNNGASPWYTSTSLGTPPQSLKFAIDTGTNILWSTSSLCAPTSCQHYGGGRFVWERSSSFAFIDRNRIPYSFGPWGTMIVETGKDLLGVPSSAALPINFYLSADYSGPQFAQIDWDGGIGIPSGTAYVQQGNSFIVGDLMNNGTISPSTPYVSFNWDPSSHAGSAELGGFDTTKYIPSEGIFMPWTPYTQFKGVEYLWSTRLDSYKVGFQPLGTNLQFALDSGSSQFKGDDYVMSTTLFLLTKLGYPPVTLGINGGEISVPSDLYMVKIEAGPNQGQVLPQFAPLGLTNLVLVGSVLMEYCYTIFAYRVVINPSGAITLAPSGMYAFNKPGGPKIITKPSADLHMANSIAPTKYT